MNQAVVVTGAGAGLGRALVIEAVRRGHRVAAIGRDARGLEAPAEVTSPDRYLPLAADVAEVAAMEAAFGKAVEHFGPINALFANAAVYPRLSLLDQSPEDWMRTLAINVGGVAHACRLVLPGMMAAARGRVVVVGSFADYAPISQSSAYSASKGAIHALVKAVATEVGADYPDILVNEWVPGALATKMGIPDGIDPTHAARWGLDLLDLPAGGPSGRMFDRDRLVEPPRSFKRRLVDKLLRR